MIQLLKPPPHFGNFTTFILILLILINFNNDNHKFNLKGKTSINFPRPNFFGCIALTLKNWGKVSLKCPQPAIGTEFDCKHLIN